MSSTDRLPLRCYLSPRFWPSWLALGLLRLSTLLPYRALVAMGQAMGAMLFLLPLGPKAIARKNLALCFPDKSSAERERILREHVGHIGVAVFEIALSWWAPDRKLQPLVAEVLGLEHLERARAQGRGVLLLTAHFTSLEMGGRLLRLYAPLYAMYREQSNPIFDRAMRRGRERQLGRIIHRNDVRGLLGALREGMPVWYAPDQNYAGAQSVFAPFFGIPAATSSATARLARTTGAPVVPFFPERLPGNRGYRLRILPALEDFPGGEVAEDTGRINRVIEEQVRRCPEQYFWVHRRFKSRPPGEANLYAD